MKKIISQTFILSLVITTFLLLLINTAPIYAQETGEFAILDIWWGDEAQKIEVGPGSINVPLTMKILYKGEDPLIYARIRMVLPEGITGVDGATTVSMYISPNINRGDVITVSFRLNIDKNLKTGTYPTFFVFQGFRAEADDKPEVFNSVTTIDLQIKGEVKIKAETTDSTLVAGSRNILPIIFRNTGTGLATKIKILVTASQQISVLVPEFEVESLGPGESITLSVPLYVSASLGGSSVSLSLTINYLDAYLNSRSLSTEIGLITSQPSTPSLLLEISPNELAMLTMNDVGLRISNLGGAAITDLSVTLTPSSPLILIGSDGKFSVGTLEAGKSIVLPLSLYVMETAAQSSQISVLLSYIDAANQLRTESRMLNIFITAEPKQLLSPIDIRINPKILYSGMINNVSVTVKNVGTSQLRAVTLTFPTSGSSITWLDEGAVSIDQLEPGNEHSFVCKVFVSSDAPSSLALTLSLNYYGSDNILKQEQRQVGVLVKGLIKFEVADFAVLPENPSIGQTFSVTLILVNTGTSKASSVAIQPSRIEGFRTFGQSRSFLGDVSINTPTSVTFSFSALNNTKPGINQIPFVLSFKDSLGETHTQELMIPVRIVAQQSMQQTQVQTARGSEQTGLISPMTIILLTVIGAICVVVGFIIGRRTRK
ncbi:MAG: hypothetical protein QXV24_05245 [Nitrososphaerota archaeon]